MYIDTHAHLYHKQFNSDRGEMLQRALAGGVVKLLLPNIDFDSVDAMHAMVKDDPATCFPMMGLHPCSVSADPEADLAPIEKLLRKGKYIAVGEIGIDLYWDKTLKEQQEHAFRQQVRWAKELKLPIVIHCRNSFEETIKIVEEENAAELRGVFHCFTGSPEDATRVIALKDFYLGIGGVITFKNGGLDETMAAVGPEHCVLETDAPYLAPIPHRGKRNESSYIPLIAAKLAEVCKITAEDVARVTTRNAEELFTL